MACPRYIPYGSIVAAILVYCGMGLFCGASLTAFNHTASMFSTTEIDESNVIKGLRITVYVVTPVMVVVALFYVLQGYAATKQSKVQVYDNRSVLCGGMGCVSAVLYAAYLVTFLWLIIGGACSVPVIFMYMVHKYTSTVDITPSLCLDLQVYGFVNLPDGQNSTICGLDIEPFGKLAREAMVMYAILLGGCLLVILGMIHFLMCLSANWGHLKDGLKRRDYETRRRLEEEELHELSVSSLRGPRAKVYDTNMSQVAYNPQLPPIGGFGEHRQHRHSTQPTMSTERLVNDYY